MHRLCFLFYASPQHDAKRRSLLVLKIITLRRGNCISGIINSRQCNRTRNAINLDFTSDAAFPSSARSSVLRKICVINHKKQKTQRSVFIKNNNNNRRRRGDTTRVKCTKIHVVRLKDNGKLAANRKVHAARREGVKLAAHF